MRERRKSPTSIRDGMTRTVKPNRARPEPNRQLHRWNTKRNSRPVSGLRRLLIQLRRLLLVQPERDRVSARSSPRRWRSLAGRTCSTAARTASFRCTPRQSIPPPTEPASSLGSTANLIGTASVTDGGSLGFSDPAPSSVKVTFNATGLADLNAAAGKQFYIGGTFTGADPYVLLPGPGGLTFANLFNGSGNVAGAQLSLTTSVPEPSTWAMLLAGSGLSARPATAVAATERRSCVEFGPRIDLETKPPPMGRLFAIDCRGAKWLEQRWRPCAAASGGLEWRHPAASRRRAARHNRKDSPWI